MRKNPIILPYDGFQDADVLLQEVESDLRNLDLVELLSFVKINDAVFLPPFSGSEWVWKLWGIIRKHNLHLDLRIFLDLKLSDTKGTVKNIATHFVSFQQKILTVRSNLSGKGYLEIRRVLPDVKIALVSFSTDNSEQDCLEQYGLFPEEKILHDMRTAQRKYKRVCGDGDPKFAFDMVVCSPKELSYLMRNELPIFGKRFEKISPGIRDEWMEKGQQVRVAGVAQALMDGADYVVMGSQMKNGNPEKGISAAESRRRTRDEIERALMEMANR